MQGTWVRPLVQEDSICHRGNWSPCTTTTEAQCREPVLLNEARWQQLESSPCSMPLEKDFTATKTRRNQKKERKLFKKRERPESSLPTSSTRGPSRRTAIYCNSGYPSLYSTHTVHKCTTPGVNCNANCGLRLLTWGHCVLLQCNAHTTLVGGCWWWQRLSRVGVGWATWEISVLSSNFARNV